MELRTCIPAFPVRQGRATTMASDPQREHLVPIVALLAGIHSRVPPLPAVSIATKHTQSSNWRRTWYTAGGYGFVSSSMGLPCFAFRPLALHSGPRPLQPGLGRRAEAAGCSWTYMPTSPLLSRCFHPQASVSVPSFVVLRIWLLYLGTIGSDVNLHLPRVYKETVAA
jgi:hypothetical protein